MTTCVFVQIRCKPGTTYRVAEEITLREIVQAGTGEWIERQAVLQLQEGTK